MSIGYCGCQQLQDFYEKNIVKVQNNNHVELDKIDYGDIGSAMNAGSYIYLVVQSPVDGTVTSLTLNKCPVCGTSFGQLS
ncbi:MAG: hypothetical protein AB7U98_01310 [Candidatus Nitrosocosmicus sp.]